MEESDSSLGAIIFKASLEREKDLAKLRAEQHARPFLLPQMRAASSGDYQLCVTPQQALDAFSLSTRSLSVTQLHRELKSGRVQAVCHEAIMFIDNQKTNIDNAIIDTWFWHLETPVEECDFWETGYFRALIPRNQGRSSWQGDVELFGVRFWPEGLPGGASNPLPSDRVVSEDSALPSLPEAEANRVAKALNDYWGPSLTEKRAVELARGMCPEHRVSRDPFLDVFRAIRGPKSPGKPASNGK